MQPKFVQITLDVSGLELGQPHEHEIFLREILADGLIAGAELERRIIAVSAADSV